jgi:hypothetical protein
MSFENWLDENYPYRNRNYKKEILYAKSKYDDIYLESELLEIYKEEIMKEDEVIVDGIIKLPRVTRVEVIDENGRSYVKYGVEVELSYQDSAQTLKLFLKKRT